MRARGGALTTPGPSGRVAAQNMLAQEAEISTVPYLWTAMFSKSLRYAGNNGPRTRAGPRCGRVRRRGLDVRAGLEASRGRGHDGRRWKQGTPCGRGQDPPKRTAGAGPGVQGRVGRALGADPVKPSPFLPARRVRRRLRRRHYPGGSGRAEVRGFLH